MSDPNLPPGVTQEMCEGGPPQYCANCGHASEFHGDTEDTSCEHRQAATKFRKEIDCECPGYVEGEYEPCVIGDDGF